MEVMEDGNLMDKVHILIQRDMEYYKDKQKVLQENICTAIVGGHLDFPRYASFAAVKLVVWWEDEFIAAYRHGSGFMQQSEQATGQNMETSGGCGGIVKSSDPSKFVELITKSAAQLLEHLHVLTQEALDHADLSVLTGTIGAAALIKNCLWCYIHYLQDSDSGLINQLQKSHKQYQEMAEALAERLLDLHCRLLSLYILQDADSLDWENSDPFCESERGSYVIQMWWLYMQGTKEDLWNTVPAKMAQRVFSGMLNETLSILTVRYSQISPSRARSELLIVDVSNLLLCVAKLLPSICENAEELMGFSLNTQSKILRDIHVKCQELLMCLILRGSPLDALYKVFRKGTKEVEFCRPRSKGPCAWMVLALQNMFHDYPKHINDFTHLPSNIAIALELSVLLAQPQSNWSLLLKILIMEDFQILKLILQASLKEMGDNYCLQSKDSTSSGCGEFLCPKDSTCKCVDQSVPVLSNEHYYDIVKSVTHIFICTGSSKILQNKFLPVIDKIGGWANSFDRRQVWNQKRPPWYEALTDLIKPLLPPIVNTVISASQTGATMYQTMSIVLGCFSQLWDCVNPTIPRLTALLQEILPVDVIPLRNSALLQILVSSLYTELLHKAQAQEKKSVSFFKDVSVKDEPHISNSHHKGKEALEHKNSVTSFDGTCSSVDSIALAIAEALCSIDEDNKHTEQIDDFLNDVNAGMETSEACNAENALSPLEISAMASDLLGTPYGKRSLRLLYHFVHNNQEWLYQNLGTLNSKEVHVPNRALPVKNLLLYTMFHIGDLPFDQLLTGDWKPNWTELLQTNMGVNAERVWNQISMRWEFQELYAASLTAQDSHLVSQLSKAFKQA